MVHGRPPQRVRLADRRRRTSLAVDHREPPKAGLTGSGSILLLRNPCSSRLPTESLTSLMLPDIVGSSRFVRRVSVHPRTMASSVSSRSASAFFAGPPSFLTSAAMLPTATATGWRQLDDR